MGQNGRRINIPPSVSRPLPCLPPCSCIQVAESLPHASATQYTHMLHETRGKAKDTTRKIRRAKFLERRKGMLLPIPDNPSGGVTKCTLQSRVLLETTQGDPSGCSFNFVVIKRDIVFK